ncbi:MAG: cation-translocating P-type ATPase [Ruminococcus sp.]|nr:cation-translocating P-type ATPase [Ruminococcus sp.]
MKFHTGTKEELLSRLGSDAKNGLTEEEAAARLGKYGPNKLKEGKKKTYLQRFLGQFADVMILILLAAAAVSFVIAVMEGETKGFFEPSLILLIVILNALMGVMQESRAEKALDALKNMSAPHAKVIRGGKEQIIDASGLAPGDVIRLEAGDFVPADARLIKSASLKSEESALTGESVPSEKDENVKVPDNAPLGDCANMVFSGCSITYGTATAVVTATGMDTEMGQIANLLEGAENAQTPLQAKLAQLGRYLGIMALVACAIIFVIGLVNGIPLLEIFMTAVSLAVSAIPEGIPAIVTIVLSIGVQRMVKKNALIRRLPAVETLGSASVICSDKTGTLTQNRMTLMKAYLDESTAAETGESEVPPLKSTATDARTPENMASKTRPPQSAAAGTGRFEDIGTHNSEAVKKLLLYGTLCCDGSLSFQADEVTHIGDPTETSIVFAAWQNGMEKNTLLREYPRLAELPFDSDRKLMSTVHQIDGKYVVIVKGAFDVMASRCITGDLEAARTATEQMSADALRVLAIGYKEIDRLLQNPTSEELENGLTLMGLVGMIDPPRPEAKAAVETCKKAGIKPVMITGDHIVTASAIASELGILSKDDKAITGTELDTLTDGELDDAVEHIAVYARVSPENKIRIVKSWQRKGHVVSMTGDGVNDAPALKAADIGCAMGITGTDVAKGAADMTLTDDNFATIVDAVREGRGIYANIRKVVGFLLGTNIGEVVLVFISMLLWHKTPLLSMQLLWINLVTDSLPAIALGMEAVEADVMEQPPKPKNESIFAHGLGVRIVLQGFMFGILSLIAFKLGESSTGLLAGGQTMAFMVLALSQVIQAFNMRSDRSLFKIGLFGNRTLNLSALVSILMVALVLFTPVRIVFGLVLLPTKLYLLGLVLILVPMVIMEVSKACGLIKHQH